ncbi:MAG: hypothetical protein LBE36_09455 [Flavobacteriaceae bacterium]|jgi:hypothetical protein|nr:hypothetical protein [Flavobacteriaceae bacterium]
MKKIALTFALFFAVLAFGQTQDLYSLAKGDFLGFNALFDDKDNLYGYVALYDYGKSGDKTKKLEYVILDKNLNPVANKEFEGDITAKDYFGYIDFRNKVILAPSDYDISLIKNKDFFYPRSMEIDLQTNTIKYKVYYDYADGNFTEIAQPKNWKEDRKENKAEKKEKGYNYESYVWEIKEGGYLVAEYNDYGSYINNNALLKFDENKNQIWKYEYNTSGDKKTSEVLKVIDKNENYVFCILQKNNKKDKSTFLVVLDMKTGKEVHNQTITSASPETLERITYYLIYYSSAYSFVSQNLSNDKVFDDKIVMVGRNFDKDKSIGFARMIIDKTNFNVDVQTIEYEKNFKPFLPKLTGNDKFSDGYYLWTKDFFFMEDGSVGILMEKYKPGGQYNAEKTKDLYCAFLDKDFKVTDLKVFEKEKTKWANNDYLFSQYLNDGKDVVFFYRDLQKDQETKDKNWQLFINTFIDGKFKQEQVQISEKDKYVTFPYVGKEGYILLREYNEKDKFNKIRLERLNY